jgi:hypothetical protein
MKFSFFYHSLESDWSHGSAHFLRGVVAELLSRGHEVQVFEPDDSWSRENLLSDHGAAALNAFYDAYPGLSSRAYSRSNLDMERVAEESDVVLVHEWNEPWLVNGFGELRNRLQAGGNHDLDFCLLFHDTHHRAISDPSWLHRFRLDYYDGVLAFGEVLSDLYRKNGWTQNVWTWHEAADTRVFYPREPNPDLPSGWVIGAMTSAPQNLRSFSSSRFTSCNCTVMCTACAIHGRSCKSSRWRVFITAAGYRISAYPRSLRTIGSRYMSRAAITSAACPAFPLFDLLKPWHAAFPW